MPLPQAVGHPTPLLITHRLDQATEGVLVLGKTTAFVARFNALIRSSEGRSVRKFYRALTAAAPPEGVRAWRQRLHMRCWGGCGSAFLEAVSSFLSPCPCLLSCCRPAGAPPQRVQALGCPSTPFALSAPSPVICPVPLHAGPLVHHLSVSKRQAGLPFYTIAHDAPAPDSARCELRVLEVGRVGLAGAAAERWGPSAYECLLELITGKTHQVTNRLLGDD